MRFQVSFGLGTEIAFRARVHGHLVLALVNVQNVCVQIVLMFGLEITLVATVHDTLVRRQMDQHVPFEVVLKFGAELALVAVVHGHLYTVKKLTSTEITI